MDVRSSWNRILVRTRFSVREDIFKISSFILLLFVYRVVKNLIWAIYLKGLKLFWHCLFIPDKIPIKMSDRRISSYPDARINVKRRNMFLEKKQLFSCKNIFRQNIIIVCVWKFNFLVMEVKKNIYLLLCMYNTIFEVEY